MDSEGCEKSDDVQAARGLGEWAEVSLDRVECESERDVVSQDDKISKQEDINLNGMWLEKENVGQAAQGTELLKVILDSEGGVRYKVSRAGSTSQLSKVILDETSKAAQLNEMSKVILDW